MMVLTPPRLGLLTLPPHYSNINHFTNEAHWGVPYYLKRVTFENTVNIELFLRGRPTVKIYKTRV